MSPTEMEVRVARAICGTTRAAFDQMSPQGQEAALVEARAAIRAMRDWPTIPMTDAGINAGGLARRSHAVTVWQAMIDAASPPRGGV